MALFKLEIDGDTGSLWTTIAAAEIIRMSDNLNNQFLKMSRLCLAGSDKTTTPRQTLGFFPEYMLVGLAELGEGGGC